MNKYHNKKVSAGGKVFDSKKEARRFIYLSALQKEGKIRDLRTQVEFPLLPAQREESTEVYTKGKHKGEYKQGKLLERGIVYRADFAYYTKDGIYIVEDAKGVRTEAYKIKKKLMLYFHKIHIREV